MRKHVLVLASIALAALAFALLTSSAPGGAVPAEAVSLTSTKVAECGGHNHGATHGVYRHGKLVRKAYNRHKDYTDDDPRKRWEKNRLRHFRHCAKGDRARKQMREDAAYWRQSYRGWQRSEELARSLTPYVDPNGNRWAIPWEIVWCESGPGGSWTAYNESSGARGPYQFLGWDVPWPVYTDADKLAHHRMAAELWAGGAGRSHWVC
jgi:hypothetical protein